MLAELGHAPVDRDGIPVPRGWEECGPFPPHVKLLARCILLLADEVRELTEAVDRVGDVVDTGLVVVSTSIDRKSEP
jgi:hypothetical protein